MEALTTAKPPPVAVDIRPWHSEEAATLAALYSPELAERVALPVLQGAEAFTAWATGYLAEPGRYLWTVRVAGHVAGLVSAKCKGPQAVQWIWLGQAYQRKGVGTRTFRWVSDQLLNEGLQRVKTRVLPNNTASQRMLQAAGFAPYRATEEWHYWHKTTESYG